MFNLAPDPSATPITAKQVAFLGKLLTKHGKAAYLNAKHRLGISEGTTLLRLTRWQASALIDELKGGRR